MAGLLFEEKEYFEVRSERVQRGFLSERKGGGGGSLHVEKLKTDNTREPTVESLVRGFWRLRV